VISERSSRRKGINGMAESEIGEGACIGMGGMAVEGKAEGG
jgi:hypothetical protein